MEDYYFKTEIINGDESVIFVSINPDYIEGGFDTLSNIVSEIKNICKQYDFYYVSRGMYDVKRSGMYIGRDELDEIRERLLYYSNSDHDFRDMDIELF